MRSLVLVFIAGIIISDYCNAISIRKKTDRKILLAEKITLRIVKRSWVPDDHGEKLSSFPPPDVKKNYCEDALSYRYTFYAAKLRHVEMLLQGDHGYNSSLPSIFIFHPVAADADHCYVKNIVAALTLKGFLERYNIFTFNLQLLRKMMTLTSRFPNKDRKRIEVLSETIGSYLQNAIRNQLMTPDDINIIGFSYSSHLAGYIGRYLANQNDGNLIQSILGLDPDNMSFMYRPWHPVSSEDAQAVHFYHTTTAGCLLANCGSADFVFNGEPSQPGCKKYAGGRHPTRLQRCDHEIAVRYFWNVILDSSQFQARFCISNQRFRNCRCDEENKVEITYPPVKSISGKYFIRTSKHFGNGEGGSHCKHKKRSGVQ